MLDDWTAEVEDTLQDVRPLQHLGGQLKSALENRSCVEWKVKQGTDAAPYDNFLLLAGKDSYECEGWSKSLDGGMPSRYEGSRLSWLKCVSRAVSLASIGTENGIRSPKRFVTFQFTYSPLD